MALSRALDAAFWTLMAPHRSRGVLHRLRTVLTGPDAHRVLDPDDEDLPVAHLTLSGARGDRQLVNDDGNDLRPHHRLYLEPRTQRDVHRPSAIRLGVAALRAA